MPDTADIIAGAMADAEAGDTGAADTGAADSGANAADSGDTGAAVEAGGDAGGPVPAVAGAAPTPATDTGTAAPAAATPPDEIDQLLEQHGFRPTQPGQREGRIPHSRAKKMIESALKEERAAREAAVKEVTEKLTPAQQRAELLDNINRVATEQPEAFMQMLVKANPAYQKFIDAVNKPAAPAPAVSSDDPMPQPDARFPDDSLGYSQEGLTKLMEWQARNVEKRVLTKANEDFTKRFGPIEERYQAEQTLNAQIPLVRQRIADAKETWGDLFTKHEEEILKAVREDKVSPFHKIVERVLIGKLKADRNKIREEVIAEINKRPAAAASSTPSAAGTTTAKVTGGSTEDIIRQAIRGVV